MSVLSFFQWCENSWLGEAIRDSHWLFPVIESFHLLALAVIGGAVLMLNLRLFGFGVRSQPPAQLWRDTRPWLLGSWSVMLVSGLLLFTSEATKLYYHEAFWVKMSSLVMASLFTFTVLRNVALADVGADAGAGARGVVAWRRRVVALISTVLWTGVGVGGRWIGFS